MEFTKFGHACIRIDEDGRRLVIDPGMFSEPEAVDGATDILITHEHGDHFSEEHIRRALAANPELTIWTNGSVADQLDGVATRVKTVGHGDTFEAAGFSVQVHGEIHAEIHRDIPRIKNIGFMINGKVFHPGDALTVPDQSVETLMIPAHAPWSRIADLIDWAREVEPQQSYAVHDGLLNDTGLGMVARMLGELSPANYSRLAPGESAHIH